MGCVVDCVYGDFCLVIIYCLGFGVCFVFVCFSSLFYLPMLFPLSCICVLACLLFRWLLFMLCYYRFNLHWFCVIVTAFCVVS